MMRSVSTVLIAAVMAGATPVHAQEYSDPMGFRLKAPPADWRDVTKTTPPELTLMRTAQCLVDDREKEIAVYLRSIPGSAAEQSAYHEFEKKVSRCMPEMDTSMIGNAQRARGTLTMRFEHSALRGALAENMIRKRGLKLDPAKLQLGDKGMYVAENFHGGRSDDPARSFPLGFAGCVMGHNAAAMETVFSTKPGSPEEKQEIIAIAPSFSECLMEGQQLSLSAPILRIQLAEVVYCALNDEGGASTEADEELKDADA